MHRERASGYGDVKIRGGSALESGTVVESVDSDRFVAFCPQADHNSGRK
jgi:hypothetical protein